MLIYRTLDIFKTELSDDLIEFREQALEVRDHPHGSKLTNNVIIGDLMLDQIEKLGLDHIYIYTILGCKSIDGICPRCFGLKYDTKTYPFPGEYVGYQAVQSIGEPTAQLVLDTHKRSETTDGTSSVNALEEILKFPTVNKELTFTRQDGLVSIKSSGYTEDNHDTVAIYINDELLAEHIKINDLTVFTNDQVYSGDIVYSGLTDYLEMSKYTKFVQVQAELWKSYLGIFGNEKIMARNFELIAKAQTEFGIALETKGTYITGTSYYVNDLLRDEIDFIPNILSQREAMKTARKVMASVSHSYMLQNITTHAITATKNLESSNVGRTVVGDLLTSPIETTGIIVKTPKNNISAVRLEQRIRADRNILNKLTESKLLFDVAEYDPRQAFKPADPIIVETESVNLPVNKEEIQDIKEVIEEKEIIELVPDKEIEKELKTSVF
jgi:hypothetical protein